MTISEIPTELLDFIRIRVWSGFYDAADIKEFVTEGLEEEQFVEGPLELSEEQVDELVDNEFEKKVLAELQWPAVTDCDRLTAAFRTLNDKRIVSLENAGYTLSDGWSDIREAISELPPGTARGGCFYHEQDLERAVDGGGLDLCFGSISGTDEEGLAIAAEVVSVLQRAGFKPEWNGTIGRRIYLPLDWRRRYSK